LGIAPTGELLALGLPVEKDESGKVGKPGLPGTVEPIGGGGGNG